MPLANRQEAYAVHAIDSTAVLEQALEMHANVRQTSQWVKAGTPPQVTASELETLQLHIKTLLQSILTTQPRAQVSRPHQAYTEALSDFRIAISVWLLNVRRGAGISASTNMQYELHASKTEFLGKLWLNTIAAPEPSTPAGHTSGTQRKFAHSGWWQSMRSINADWSVASRPV
jgi:hypothetical protein